MKHIVILFIAIYAGVGGLMAQDKVVSSARNSVTVKTPLVATTTEAEINNANSITQIQYFDGLGRPNIQVDKGITPSKADLVTMTGFDRTKMTNLEFLPFPATVNGTPNTATLIQQSRTYYNDDYAHVSVEDHTNNIIPTLFKMLPGRTYHASNKKSKTALFSNGNASESSGYALDKVRKYVMQGNSIKYVGQYGNNQLEYLQSIDEEGKEQCTYYDRYGKTVLSRLIESGVKNSGGHYNSFVASETYYVYDEKDRLCAVLSPEATTRMNVLNRLYTSAGQNTVNNPVDQYCYLYRYDGFDRCIAKKLPGADWTYYVYDQAGRLVLSQDGNQRANSEWTFCKYNKHGQPVQEGKTRLTTAHASLRATYSQKVVVENWVKGTGYTNNHPIGTNPVILTQNFYNDYDFNYTPICAGVSALVSVNISSKAGYEAGYIRKYENVDISTRGMLTGTAVKMLDADFNKVTFLRYNRLGKLVMNRSTNHLARYDRYWYKYNFIGQLEKYYHQQQAELETIFSTGEEYFYTYDHAGRNTATSHKINTFNPVDIQLIQYDELGRVKKKGIHNSINGGLEYTYNMLGQVTKIDAPANDIGFSQQMTYKLSGNINTISEKLGAESTYTTYTYDKLNRLDNALVEYNKTSSSLAEKNARNTYQYDKNGNITYLKRQAYGYLIQPARYAVGDIDLLTMTYDGNRLKKVEDRQTPMDIDGIHFVDRNSASYPSEYLYDRNGNITGDYNKNIAWIQYNSLNLPAKVQFGNGNKSEYLYDATAVKKRAIYSTSQNVMQIPLGSTTENTTGIQRRDTVDYVDNFRYKNRKLQYIYTPVGYIDATDADPKKWQHVYYLTDYRGDIRMEVTTYGGLGSTLTSLWNRRNPTRYHAFGQSHEPMLRHQHAGNEMEKSNGLYQHDFNFRWYDQLLGRFTTMDPLSENYYGISPYAYCANNPVNFTDPWGLAYFRNGSAVYWEEGNNDDFITRNGIRYDNIGDAFKLIEKEWISYHYKGKCIGRYKYDSRFGGISRVYFPDGTEGSYVDHESEGRFMFEGFSDNKDGTVSYQFPTYYPSNGNGISQGLNNVHPEFILLTGGRLGPQKVVSLGKEILGTMSGKNTSTTNTFDANKSGFAAGNTEKMGRGKGDMSGNRMVQKEQFNSVVKELNLNKTERRILHDNISGQGMGYHEIRALAKELFNK